MVSRELPPSHRLAHSPALSSPPPPLALALPTIYFAIIGLDVNIWPRTQGRRERDRGRETERRGVLARLRWYIYLRISWCPVLAARAGVCNFCPSLSVGTATTFFRLARVPSISLSPSPPSFSPLFGARREFEWCWNREERELVSNYRERRPSTHTIVRWLSLPLSLLPSCASLDARTGRKFFFFLGRDEFGLFAIRCGGIARAQCIYGQLHFSNFNLEFSDPGFSDILADRQKLTIIIPSNTLHHSHYYFCSRKMKRKNRK